MCATFAILGGPSLARSSGTSPITPIKDLRGFTGGMQLNSYFPVTSNMRFDFGLFELNIPVPLIIGLEFGAFYEERKYLEKDGLGAQARLPILKFPMIMRIFFGDAFSFGLGLSYGRSRSFLGSQDALSPSQIHTSFKDEVAGVVSSHINFFPKSKMGLWTEVRYYIGSTNVSNVDDLKFRELQGVFGIRFGRI